MALNGQWQEPAPDADADLEGDVAIQQQIRDLDEKTDDIRASVSAVVASQAQLVGKMDVLATKLESAERVTDFRLKTLEIEHAKQDGRAWVEKLVYGAIGLAGGAGAYNVLQRIFHVGP